MRLDGKSAIITGGSRGIGSAVADAFFKQGCSLVLAARDKTALEEARQGIAGSCDSVSTFPSDISREEDVRLLVDHTLGRFGKVDILVNSAAIYGPIGPATTNDSKSWLEAIHINLFGTFLCIKAVLPHMIARRKGKIINFSGGGSVTPFPRFSAYSASKAAVVRLTETLAHEVKGYNIDINAVAPGAVNTRMLDQVLAAGEKAGSEFLAKAKRQKEEGGTSPQRAADLALFLASNESDGLSGRLISAVWDSWQDIPLHLKDIKDSDIFTMRRILPEDRGFKW